MKIIFTYKHVPIIFFSLLIISLLVDSNIQNNIKVQASTDSLVLTKSVDKVSYATGDTLTYTINYTASAQVTNAVIEDPIPSGTFYMPGSATLNGAVKTDQANDDQYSFQNNKATWNLGTLAAGTGSVTFKVKIPVNLATYGNVGQGSDDTAIIQNALNDTASKGQVLYIPATTAHYHIQPLFPPSNSKILLQSGTVVEPYGAYNDSEGDSFIKIFETNNITIEGYGATFQMTQAIHDTTGEHRHGVEIIDGNYISIFGIACNLTGGDGFYIGTNSSNPSSPLASRNIYFADISADHNRRQGMSIISAENMLVQRSSFNNTDGTAPMDGIDIEPNSSAERLVNVKIENSTTSGNKGQGIEFFLSAMSSPTQALSVTISNHTDTGAMENGYRVRKSGGTTGSITFNNCKSISANGYGAIAQDWKSSGPTLTFNNLNVQNPARNFSGSNQPGYTTGRRYSAGVAVTRDQYSSEKLGNVHFNNSTISGTSSSFDYYFFVDDKSIALNGTPNMGNVEILPGITGFTGAKNPYGYFQGASVTSVDIP